MTTRVITVDLKVPVAATMVLDFTDEEFERFIDLIRAKRCLHCGARPLPCYCQRDE